MQFYAKKKRDEKWRVRKNQGLWPPGYQGALEIILCAKYKYFFIGFNVSLIFSLYHIFVITVIF